MGAQCLHSIASLHVYLFHLVSIYQVTYLYNYLSILQGDLPQSCGWTFSKSFIMINLSIYLSLCIYLYIYLSIYLAGWPPSVLRLDLLRPFCWVPEAGRPEQALGHLQPQHWIQAHIQFIHNDSAVDLDPHHLAGSGSVSWNGKMKRKLICTSTVGLLTYWLFYVRIMLLNSIWSLPCVPGLFVAI